MSGDWREDPTHRHEQRFHDGAAWTARVRDRGIENVDQPGRFLAGGDEEPTGASSSHGGGNKAVFGRIGSVGPTIPTPSPPVSPAPSGPAAPYGSPGGGPFVGPAGPSGHVPSPAAAVPPPPGAPVGEAPSVGRSRSVFAVLGAVLASMGILKLVTATVAVVAIVGVTVVVIVQVAKPTRSVAAFCETMKSEQDRILANFNESAGDGTIDDFSEAMTGMVATVEALGELQVYFAKLAKVAPPEIEAETQLVADKIGDQLKVPDFSITGFGNQLMGALMLSGPMDTVNQFALKNCGQSV